MYRCFLIHFVIMANGSRGQIELSHWLLSLDFTVWTVTTESFHFKYYFLRQQKSSHERQIIIESGKFHLSWNFFSPENKKKFTLKEHLIYGVNFNTQTKLIIFVTSKTQNDVRWSITVSWEERNQKFILLKGMTLKKYYYI